VAEAGRRSCHPPGADRRSEPSQSQKRGGRSLFVTLDGVLEELARMNPRQATMAESRFFGGPEIAEIATLLEIFESTVLRDWRAARAWLATELRRG
jgi:DNA-directed RNA polymerase specialized sigma24 family protein